VLSDPLYVELPPLDLSAEQELAVESAQGDALA
jgi:hypothetical protein